MPKNTRTNRRNTRKRIPVKPTITKPAKTRRDPLLTGTAVAGGRTVRFRASAVRTVSLKDINDDVIGISFPSNPGDKADVTGWASKQHRTSDTKYIRDYTIDAEDYDARFTPAKWAGRNPPFYVHAHSTPDTFTVKVKSVSRAGLETKERVRIDGSTHGQLVSFNVEFQRATRRNRPKPVVYLSCSAGNPAGNAAKSSAAFLHSLRKESTIYAPTGTGERVELDPGDTSWYGVRTPAAGGVGKFKKFPPPHS